MAILGAGGRTGRCLVDAALADGHQVRAVVPRLTESWSRLSSVEVVLADVRDVGALERAVDGCDAIAWAVGGRDAVRTTLYGHWRHPPVCTEGTRATLEAMQRRNVHRLLVISSWGVGDGRRRLPPAFRLLIAPLLLRKGLADKQRQEQLVRASDRLWTIVRPTRLTGGAGRGSYRVGAHLRYAGTASTTRRDLADFVLRCLDAAAYCHETVEISST